MSTFRLYWTAYGGWRAFRRSPYVHASWGLTALLFPLWWAEGWWDITFSVVPSILGFSLSAYAIILSFGQDKFIQLLQRAKLNRPNVPEREQTSAFVEMSATFTHFLVTQTLAMFLALIAKAYYVPPPSGLLEYPTILQTLEGVRIVLWALGFFALVYAICSGLAATMRIFKLTLNFEWFQRAEDARNEQKLPEQPT